MQRRRSWVAVLSAMTLILVGCGDDDDDAAPTDDEPTVTAAAAEADPEWCADVAKVQRIEPDIPEDASEEESQRIGQEFFTNEFLPLLRKIETESPDDVKADVTAVREFAEEKGGEFFEDPGFAPLEAKANGAAAEACGLDENGVTAIDYAFQGAPAKLEAGLAFFRFTNNGKELHEMALIRKKADTTESFDELLELPEEEAMEKTEFGGGAFAFPGTTDTAILELEAGEYAMLCFIPVGLTPDKAMADEEVEGPPHFTQGMKFEFTVS